MEQNCYVGTNYISVGNKQDTSLDNSLALKCTLTTYISARPSKIHLEIVHMEIT